MSRKPRFLAENFYNEIMFSGHAVSANEAATGSEAWRVGTGRRLNSRNKWSPNSANADAWVKVVCDEAREADCLVLDRGHNLRGHTVQLQRSTDDFAADTTTVFSVTIPSSVTVGDDLSATPGVLTEEGAWAYQFTAATSTYWRIHVPAMGASLKPEIVGAYLGKSFEPDYLQDLPFTDEEGEVVFDEVRSDTAWSASSRAAQRRASSITLRLSGTEAEYLAARYTIGQLFMKQRRLMWIFHDQEQAERALLAKIAPGRYDGLARRDGWFPRQTTFDYFEHQPLQVT